MITETLVALENKTDELQKCSECGTTEQLQRHHTSYDPEEKMILCVNCHRKRHIGHGVGMSTFQRNNMPPNFTDLWKTRTYSDIMKELNISYATVYNWAMRLKLGLKRRKRVDIGKKVKMTIVLPDDLEEKLRDHIRYKGDLSRTIQEALEKMFNEKEK